MKEDKRLDRLLDYTKFHVGIYLSFGGGLVGLIGASSSAEKLKFLQSFVHSPKALAASLFFMALAGLAGGIVASGCTQAKSFDHFWFGKQGPFGAPIMRGKCWAMVEHASFWISLGLITYSVLGGGNVINWIIEKQA